MGEDDVVLHQLRRIALVVGRRQFHKYADAVLVAQLDVAGMESCGGTEIGAIDVDAEASLVAFLQSDVAEPYAFARLVVHPERACHGGHVAEHGVELHGVDREGEAS